MYPHWTLLCSWLNSTMQYSASSSAIMTHSMQVRQKGAIQGLTAKARIPKWVNHAGEIQMALLLVQITSRSLIFRKMSHF